LLAHLYQLAHDGCKWPPGLNLWPIPGHQVGIGQAPGDRLGAALAGQERIGAALDARTVLALNHEELFRERAAPQLLQAGELREELLVLVLVLVLEMGVSGQRLFHIVVLPLQYTGKNQAKKPKPTFISSTRRIRRRVRRA
jgi:hypothetical protein